MLVRQRDTRVSPLYNAASAGHLAVARALLSAGAAVNQARVSFLGSVYPLYRLWIVRVSVVVWRWYVRVYGVWWRTREVERA